MSNKLHQASDFHTMVTIEMLQSLHTAFADARDLRSLHVYAQPKGVYARDERKIVKWYGITIDNLTLWWYDHSAKYPFNPDTLSEYCVPPFGKEVLPPPRIDDALLTKGQALV